MVTSLHHKLSNVDFFLFVVSVWGEKSLDFGHFTKTTDSRANGSGSSGGDSPSTTGHDLLAALALPDTNSSALDSVL
jgi:hypothetical protein